MSQGLFVELLGGFGDLLLALPAIDALVATDRDRAWDLLTFAPGDELLAGDPRLRRVYRAQAGPARSDQVHPPCWHALADRLAATAYDIVVCDARHSELPDLIAASNVPRQVTQMWSGAGPDERISALFLRRLREEGLIDGRIATDAGRLAMTADEIETARRIWQTLGVVPDRAIALNPNAGMEIKRWPEELWTQLGALLAAQDGFQVVVLEGDRSWLASAIAERIPGAVALPRLSLRLTAACLASTRGLVSADTGIAHLASAVTTPVVAIHGPTWSGRYSVAAPSRNLQSPFDCPERRPMNFTLQPCWYTGECVYRDKQSCCEDMTVDAVHEAVRTLLAARRFEAASHAA